MFERFTDCARSLLARANREAQKRNHDHVGTEHILLGLTKESECLGTHVLKGLDVDLKKLRAEVEKLSPAKPDHATNGHLTPDEREKQVIKYAIEEARDLKHSYIGSEHLLLGLGREVDGIAGKVFDIMEIHYRDLKRQTLSVVEGAHQE
jgi:ATP-dependent Clp protease ATP-binding subunit ClpC